MNARDVVVLGKFLRVVSLTASRRASDNNLDGVETAVRVELFLELTNLFTDSEFRVPWELVSFDNLILVFLFKLLLSCGKRDVLESVRCFHAKVDSQLLFPALRIINAIGRDSGDITSTHALRDLGDETLLGGFASLVNSEDIRVILGVLDDNASDKSSQINDMNGRD